MRSLLTAAFVVASTVALGSACGSAPRANDASGAATNGSTTTTPATMTSAASASSAMTTSAAPATPPGTVHLAPGDSVPPIVHAAADGTHIDLFAITTHEGKKVLVYFYPKDDTPGCTKEACNFRDALAKLQKANVVIIGVSEDDDASHRAFAKKYALPFPLLADTDGSIAAQFGVPVNKGYAARMSFLVGEDGKIRKVYPDVNPTQHADQILADVGVGGA